jgi:uncharacterized Zn finger protein
MNKQTFLNIAAKYCDRCGTEYKTDDIEIVQQEGDTYLLMLSCHKCGVSHMVSIVASRGVGSRMKLNTDLQPDEFSRLPIGKAIAANEVIDMHAVLKEQLNKLSDVEEVFGISIEDAIGAQIDKPEKGGLEEA